MKLFDYILIGGTTFFATLIILFGLSYFGHMEYEKGRNAGDINCEFEMQGLSQDGESCFSKPIQFMTHINNSVNDSVKPGDIIVANTTCEGGHCRIDWSTKQIIRNGSVS